MFTVKIEIEGSTTFTPSCPAALKLPQPDSAARNCVCLFGLEVNAGPPSRQFTFRANTTFDVCHFRLSIANSIPRLIECLSQAVNKPRHNSLSIRCGPPFRHVGFLNNFQQRIRAPLQFIFNSRIG